MKLVITIDDDIYDDYLKQGATLPKCGTAIGSLYEALWNGVPLPEHHERIIDESKINKCGWNFVNHHAKTDAPTIIEADKEEENEANN